MHQPREHVLRDFHLQRGVRRVDHVHANQNDLGAEVAAEATYRFDRDHVSGSNLRRRVDRPHFLYSPACRDQRARHHPRAVPLRRRRAGICHHRRVSPDLPPDLHFLPPQDLRLECRQPREQPRQAARGRRPQRRQRQPRQRARSRPIRTGEGHGHALFGRGGPRVEPVEPGELAATGGAAEGCPSSPHANASAHPGVADPGKGFGISAVARGHHPRSAHCTAIYGLGRRSLLRQGYIKFSWVVFDSEIPQLRKRRVETLEMQRCMKQ